MKNVHGEGHSVQSIPIANGSLASNPSTTEDDISTDEEMDGHSEEPYTDEETGKETEEESSENYDESEEEDNNPWKLILIIIIIIIIIYFYSANSLKVQKHFTSTHVQIYYIYIIE